MGEYAICLICLVGVDAPAASEQTERRKERIISRTELNGQRQIRLRLILAVQVCIPWR